MPPTRATAVTKLIQEIERGRVAASRFATRKGSLYVQLPDGTTLRHKAARPEHPGEVGWMGRSDATAFLRKQDLGALDMVQAKGPRPFTLLRDTQSPRLAVGYADRGPGAMLPIPGTVVTPSMLPAVGLYPLEMRRGYTPHFGNDIIGLEPEPNWADWIERASLGLPPPDWSW